MDVSMVANKKKRDSQQKATVTDLEKPDLEVCYREAAEQVIGLLKSFSPNKDGDIVVKVENGKPRHIDVKTEENIFVIYNEEHCTFTGEKTFMGKLINEFSCLNFGFVVVKVVKGIPEKIQSQFSYRLLL